jgi:hypothetical protein
LNQENVAFEHAKMHLSNAKAVLNWERVRIHQEKKSEEKRTAQRCKDCTRMEKRREKEGENKPTRLAPFQYNTPAHSCSQAPAVASEIPVALIFVTRAPTPSFPPIIA